MLEYRMGVFDFLFKKKRSNKDNFSNINKSLQYSFSNVKKDILYLQESFKEKDNETNQKFQLIEERVKNVESLLSRLMQNNQTAIKTKEKSTEGTSDIQYDDSFLNVLKSFQRAEIRMFKTIYELQTNLNLKHISYKSIASYLYPNKDYSSIRSAITQFLTRLNAEGLIDKRRIGKEAYVGITPEGHKLLKGAKIKKFIESLELAKE